MDQSSLVNYFVDFDIELEGVFNTFLHVNNVISTGSVYCVCIEFLHIDRHLGQMHLGHGFIELCNGIPKIDS